MKQQVIIIGAGLVGPLLATLLAQNGMDVRVFERNSDLRKRPARPGKSVNITLATRGMAVLDHVGIGEQIRTLSMPVYGRVIHARDGRTEYQPYGNRRECLYSISRHTLAGCMADMAEANGIPLSFQRRCVGLDTAIPSVRLEGESGVETLSADVLIGADGAHSAVRHHMMAQARINYSQYYADHANKEIMMSADAVREAHFRTDALHIWPRGEFMLIAFPNLDGSFTCTLHLPYEGTPSYAGMKTVHDVQRLFERYLPDICPYIPNAAEQFFAHPEIPMVTVRCDPWVLEGRVALIGDAAHAIWPSYGQGANCGFEDCASLARLLTTSSSLKEGLTQYQFERLSNANAIADLSIQHFEEIRDQVGDPLFLKRKKLERLLNQLYPEQFIPLYARVSFTQMSYVEAIRQEKEQRRLVDALMQRSDPEVAISELRGMNP